MKPETWAQAEELIADTVINSAVASSRSFDVIDAKLATDMKSLESQEREAVQRYRDRMREITRGMLMGDLGGNTAGLYDGSNVFIDRGVFMVGASVEQTIDQAREVSDHEAYHAEHHHTAPMQVVDGTRADVAAVIGGMEFSESALIEGLTVHQTGDSFVSEDYVGYQSTLETAMANAGLSITDIEAAVNDEKDLTLIDDRTQKQPHAEMHVAA